MLLSIRGMPATRRTCTMHAPRHAPDRSCAREGASVNFVWGIHTATPRSLKVTCMRRCTTIPVAAMDGKAITRVDSHSSSSSAPHRYDEEAAALRDADTAALAPLGPSLYEYHNRPRRDIWASLAYSVWLAGTLLGTFVAFGLTDKDAIGGKYSQGFYKNSTSCDINTYQMPTTGVSESPTFGSSFAVSMSIWLPISLVVGVVLSIGYFYLFRNHATKMVFATYTASAAFCFIIAIIAFAAGSVWGGIILLVLALIYAGVIWFIRDQLKLVAKLLTISGKGLQAAPGIIVAAVCIKLAGIGLMVLLFMGIVCAGFVGKVMPNPSRTFVSGMNNGYCLGPVTDFETGLTSTGYVDCCVYETTTWGAVHIFFAVLTMSWTAQVLMQLKLYVVADTLAQWYFQPPFSSGYAPVSAWTGVRHGLTSSFGSVCFSGLILAIIDMLRKAMNNAQHNSDGWMKLICCILNCIAQCVLDVLEQFTEFATIACAITGKAFIPAAKDTYETLKRNFLATFGLWWIPGFVLGMSCFLISLAWACIVYVATYAQWKGSLGDDAVGVSLTVAMVSWLAFGFVLYFLASIMLDGVHTIYICFAFDRDRKVVTHPEVHEVYLSLPKLQGAVIEQPDGGIAYGAASHSHMPPPQQHASYTAVAMTPQQHASYTAVAMTPQPAYGYGGYPAQAPPPAYASYQAYPAAPQPAPYPGYSYPAPYPAPYPGQYPGQEAAASSAGQAATYPVISPTYQPK